MRGKFEKMQLSTETTRERAHDAYFEFQKSSHLQPVAAICPSSHLQPLAHSHLQRLAAAYSQQQFQVQPKYILHRKVVNILQWKAPEKLDNFDGR